MRIGVIGGGAVGSTTAWLLEQHHEVTLFERDDRSGGHAHTVEVTAHGRRFGVDDALGRSHVVDEVVVAASADVAADLLRTVPGLEERAAQLRRFEFFDAVIAIHGEHGVWLAGMYTDDADSHESAVHSAVTIAERLAPGSTRLGMLR